MDTQSLGTAAAIAMVLVPIISLIKRDTWSTQVRQIVALAAALVAAIGGALVDGNISNVGEFVAYLGTARLVAETLYTQYFGDTPLNARLEATGNAAEG